MCKAHAEGKPFYTITQNALADGSYLEYLRVMYGRKLAMPSNEDSKRALDAYVAEAGARSERGELKRNENVTKDENGNYSVSGVTAVMGINALDRENDLRCEPEARVLYRGEFSVGVDVSAPVPARLILKLNRRPLPEMTAAMVRKDQEFWAIQMKRWIGDWVKERHR